MLDLRAGKEWGESVRTGTPKYSRDWAGRFLSLAMAMLQIVPLTAIVPLAALVPLASGQAALAAEEEIKTLGLDSPRLVLKGSEQFIVLDPDGMITPGPGSPYGLYQDDTRFLSQWTILVDGKHLHPLTALTREGYAGTFLYGNPETASLSSQSLLIKREMVLHNGFSERLTVESFVDRPQNLILTLQFDSDFHDMFEVRGQKRPKHGQKKTGGTSGLATTTYTGLDQSVVTTTIKYPASIAQLPPSQNRSQGQMLDQNRAPSQNAVDFALTLPPRGKQVLEFFVDNTTATGAKDAIAGGKEQTFQQKKDAADLSYRQWQSTLATIQTDSEPLNKMIEQAGRDIFLLRQSTPKGPCLSAGLPWYAVAFGRDQAVTGMQLVSFAPQLSKQILKVLAAYQGNKYDKFTEEAPGRILHELRLGEMARCREIPFIPFYGTIDATPLWLLLLNRYVETTGDEALARELWPNVERALDYLEKSTSDTTGGFLFYGGLGKSALSNQCWKDSGDSIMYKSGVLAKQPIAACEVQGYLYQAFAATAGLAKKLGHEDVGKRLDGKAANLKSNFQKYFWSPQQKFVALALDGEGKPCSVISSNPGHLLNSGILEGDMQDAVVSRLMQNDMYSGWGIRTLSSREVKYNPMSYHDGTVWPHDNAITIEGMAATGHAKEACQVMSSLIDAATTASDSRLPELFCGFPRTQFDSPVPYPVSCVPQAWAAGSIFEMLKATLGIYPHRDQIVVKNPVLPPGVNKLTVNNLRCGDKTLRLSFVRSGTSDRVNVSFTDGAPVKVEQSK